MKKRLLFGILILSLFLLSSATVVQPVQGYEFSVPDEAIGVTSEGEIKIFDEDEWEDHLGAGSDPTDFKSGDVDVVGAKSKSHYIEIEKDADIKFCKDHYWDGAIIDGSTASTTVTQSLWNPLITPAMGGAPAPFLYLWNETVQVAYSNATAALGLPITPTAQAILGAAVTSSENTINTIIANDLTHASNANGYSKKFDGAYLTREYWEPTEDEFDEDPDDDEDEIPFMADPEDMLDIWHYTNDFKWLQLQDLCGTGGPGSLSGGLQTFWAPQLYSCYDIGPGGAMSADGRNAYEAWNLSLALAIGGYPTTEPNPLTAIANALASDLAGSANDLTGVGGGNYSNDFVLATYGGVHVVYETIYQSIVAGYPDKPGLFIMALEAGQPIYTPQDDFTAALVETMNIDDETVYKLPFIEYGEDLNADGTVESIPVGTTGSFLTGGYDFGGETLYIYGYVDIKAEGGAIIVEIEYLDGQLDPKDVLRGEADPSELDDWEWWFEYGDTGGSSESFRDGDTIFWQSAGVDQIPGFEITVILGASALSILALIYVVMKKRKR
jgi:hypothetical protein